MSRWDAAFDAALDAARQAWRDSGDVPVGAAVLDPDGILLAVGGNERELTGDPTAHAEIVALRRAARVWAERRAARSHEGLAERETPPSAVGSAPPRVTVVGPTAMATETPPAAVGSAPPSPWRLDGCTLVVTLEPCAMCAGAAVAARLARLVFGPADPKAGAVASLFDVVRDPRLPHRLDVRSGLREADCRALLAEFFAARRL